MVQTTSEDKPDSRRGVREHRLLLTWTSCACFSSFLRVVSLTRSRILVYPFSGTGAVNVTRGDLKRLDPGQYLNDTIIEFGLKCVDLHHSMGAPLLTPL